MDASSAHTLALRSPWYVCRRGGFDRFDPRARRPALQKYAGTDLVERLLADPTDSTPYDPVEDVWGYPVPVPVAERGPGRLRFATHRMIRPGPLKLYQAAHERFYAVVIELFCEQPGLPRPGPAADDVEVGFVVRRQTLSLDADVGTVRRMARDLTGHLAAEQQQVVVGPLTALDAEDVLTGRLAQGQVIVPDGVSVTTGTEGWMVGLGGRARWRPLDGAPPDVAEQEIPMWRLPAPDGSCDAAATRSLWFGLVPTSSGEHADALLDPAGPDGSPDGRTDQGTPRYDEHAIYHVRCLARRRPPPGREHCPPRVVWSEPSAPYRLAAFFDPEGTKNRTVSITMPDLRSVAARAGQPAGPGGVQITSPPGSQLSFAHGNGSPSGGSAGGNVAQVCSFALELFMIVAFFLFMMFLPIVVLLFQLWWMLALRFCLPPSLTALAALNTHFQAGGTLTDLSVTNEANLDDLLGGPGMVDAVATAPTFPTDGGAAGGADLFAAVDPRAATAPTPPPVQEPVEDPLCETAG